MPNGRDQPGRLVTVDSSGTDDGLFSSLALESDGNPHISDYDGGSNGDLKYARWTGTAWEIEIVDSVWDVGRYTSLALDGAGTRISVIMTIQIVT